MEETIPARNMVSGRRRATSRVRVWTRRGSRASYIPSRECSRHKHYITPSDSKNHAEQVTPSVFARAMNSKYRNKSCGERASMGYRIMRATIRENQIGRVLGDVLAYCNKGTRVTSTTPTWLDSRAKAMRLMFPDCCQSISKMPGFSEPAYHDQRFCLDCVILSNRAGRSSKVHLP